MPVQQYFGRAVSVRIGLPGLFGKAYTDLRTTFSVERNTKRDPNKAKISIYNMDSVSRGLAQQTGSVILLSAGYGLFPGLLFAGDISKRGLKIEKEGPDIITTIEAGDGEIAHKDVRFIQSFGPGTPNSTILPLLLGVMVLGLAPAEPLIPLIYQNGVTFMGTAADALDRLVKDVGQGWSIQDGLVQILSPGGVRADGAVLLTSETGMIGSPVRTKDGMNFKTLLNGTIKPGSFLQVVAQDVSGFYKAHKVKHDGDTHGGSWYTEIEAKEIKP